jgi:hypothetical protein
MAIDRASVRAVALPTETATIEAIGGEVIVRGMDMTQQLRFSATRRRLTAPMDGEDSDSAAERAGGELLPLALEMCVVLDDGTSVYTKAQWAVFGGQHPGDALELFNTAMRLSGQDSRAEKKA